MARRESPKPCTFSGCKNRIDSHGLCSAHIKQRLKGVPLRPLRRKPRPTETPEQRYLQCVEKHDIGCWGWEGTVNGGYAVMGLGGRPRRAHRLSYELHRGPIPPGMFVMHSCDNRLCTRPDHLSLGTNADNIRDMRAKNRSTTGFFALDELFQLKSLLLAPGIIGHVPAGIAAKLRSIEGAPIGRRRTQ